MLPLASPIIMAATAMFNPFAKLPHLAHLPGACLYFSLAVNYALAYRAARRGGHPPSLAYLGACIIYVAFGLLFSASME